MKAIKTEQGIWNGKTYNVSTSGIFTILIKEAAECEHYSSDILVDINAINRILDVNESEITDYYIGFRSMGVDNREQIIYRRDREVYRCIYLLRFEKTRNDLKLTLFKLKEREVI